MKKYIIIPLLLLHIVSCRHNPNLEENIDSIFKEFNISLSPGASVAVVKDNETIYQKGFGYTDI